MKWLIAIALLLVSASVTAAEPVLGTESSYSPGSIPGLGAEVSVKEPGARRQPTAPDDEDIFRRILDSESPYNYPALMLRYNAGDTTLTLDDYHYLYYGYAFADDYKPLDPIPAEDELLMILERRAAREEDPDWDDMMEVVRLGQEVMKSDPFSPRNLNFLVYAYGAVGDTINERINHDRLTKVIATIEASGTGLKEGTPMHVLKFSHAADVLSARGLAIANRRVVSITVEYASLRERDGDVRGYYFDFGRMYWQKPDAAPERERRWKINDQPIISNYKSK